MRFGEFIRDFSEEAYGRLVDALNTGLYNLTLSENMSGEIKEVTLPIGGTEIEVPHSLKTTPKYRIILRQSGNGVVLDGDTEWTDRYIYLKSAALSTENLTIKVLIMRG